MARDNVGFGGGFWVKCQELSRTLQLGVTQTTHTDMNLTRVYHIHVVIHRKIPVSKQSSCCWQTSLVLVIYDVYDQEVIMHLC